MQNVKVRYLKTGKTVSMSKRYADILTKCKVVEIVPAFYQTQGFSKIEKPFTEAIIKSNEQAKIEQAATSTEELKVKQPKEQKVEEPREEVSEIKAEELKASRGPRKSRTPKSNDENTVSAWPSTVGNRASSFSIKKPEDEA